MSLALAMLVIELRMYTGWLEELLCEAWSLKTWEYQLFIFLCPWPDLDLLEHLGSHRAKVCSFYQLFLSHPCSNVAMIAMMIAMMVAMMIPMIAMMLWPIGESLIHWQWCHGWSGRSSYKRRCFVFPLAMHHCMSWQYTVNKSDIVTSYQVSNS